MEPWIPVPKAIAREIIGNAPRPFPESIAYLSVSLDADSRQKVTESGYAQLWGWSRGKVRRYLARIGAEIVYPMETRDLKNQRGQIAILTQGKNEANDGHIKLINFKGLKDEKNIKKSNKEHKMDKRRLTTINTENETEKDTTTNYLEDDGTATSKISASGQLDRVVGGTFSNYPLHGKPQVSADVDDWWRLAQIHMPIPEKADRSRYLAKAKDRVFKGGLSELDNIQLGSWRKLERNQQQKAQDKIEEMERERQLNQRILEEQDRRYALYEALPEEDRRRVERLAQGKASLGGPHWKAVVADIMREREGISRLSRVGDIAWEQLVKTAGLSNEMCIRLFNRPDSAAPGLRRTSPGTSGVPVSSCESSSNCVTHAGSPDRGP